MSSRYGIKTQENVYFGQKYFIISQKELPVQRGVNLLLNICIVRYLLTAYVSHSAKQDIVWIQIWKLSNTLHHLG